MTLPKNLDPALKKAMKASLSAYEKGDRRFFSYVSESVRVYGIDDSPTPIVGKKEFQERFTLFSKVKRKAKPIAQDVRVSGSQAILSQTLDVTANGVRVPVRQTVVWEEADGEWLMTHIHNGRGGQPVSATKMPQTARGIRVLNERIATMAAVVGVAQ